jgi:glycosyltransferase involved in cell wall biosynthesis
LVEKGCGLWVDNAPESLAEAIVEMSTMPMDEMGLRGREWMTADFSWDAVAREVCNAYSAMLGGTAVMLDAATANASVAAGETSQPH